MSDCAVLQLRTVEPQTSNWPKAGLAECARWTNKGRIPIEWGCVPSMFMGNTEHLNPTGVPVNGSTITRKESNMKYQVEDTTSAATRGQKPGAGISEAQKQEMQKK